MYNVNINVTKDPVEEGYDSKDELLLDTLEHRTHVNKILLSCAVEVINRGINHDWTKIRYFEQFAKDTEERLTNTDFKTREWYKIHTQLERHHINSNPREDVNLFDVLECICDCIVAGKSRNGKVDYKFLELDTDLLVRSYWNTVEMINENVNIVEDDVL